ncbi:2Fe-2S iron-sulfur cluster-binding protein [Ilumatobacter coccineus]|uniref:Putative oxidoreductase molybdopterin-binding subunit/oxidoreductase iron-sulfur subunit n=1 Tax=Ilumatobacter coccineus (strain NBRC 103263 / KCTC 29153 / YM16-304) TaxID=1313172 RepID=A0A6C7EFL9_ILUCY|nr:2Fe-2S iron-sulfur cluster-binding protein [Ilumatobacter coccineus]BAN03815.1 putative oxidoreductase molybdopterin-binding subunit/oxidoreductase iron-sulfur subunit [Ilumatobacter coccineus YM16-304]
MGIIENSSDVAPTKGVSRRRFLGAVVAAPTLTAVAILHDGAPAKAGLFDGLDDVLGGLVPDIGLPDVSDVVDLGDLLILAEYPYRYNLLIEVTTDNTVRLELPRLEKGQGITTACAVILADEIGARLDDTVVDLSDARLDRPFTITGSSHNVRAFWEPIRTLAAGLRARLVTAAANVWGADPFSLTTADTHVVHPDGRTLTFGELSAAAAQIVQVSTNAAPKGDDEYQIIGTRRGRVDALDIVTGAADYALDLPIAGSPAIIARSPDIGGTVASFDDTAALAMPGVIAITEVPSGIAVVARTFHEAFEAKARLDITWNPGPLASTSDADLRQTLKQAPSVPVTPGGLFTKVIDAEFEYPYLSHSPMEVMSAVADVRADSAEVWFASQSPVIALQSIAAAIGMSQTSVTLHVPRSGGSFGRRLFFEPAVEAAQISQAVGQPVKLMWTRNDDLRSGRFRPMSINRIRARVSRGKVLSFDHRMKAAETDFRHGFGEALTAAGSDVGAVAIGQSIFHTTVSVPYDFGVTTQLLTEVELPVPTSSWRSIYSGHVVTSNEIMVDRIAASIGRDPVEFRRDKLSDERAIAVLDRAAAEADWGKPMPAGVAQGVGVHVEYRSFAAYVVEIDTNGVEPRVTKVTVAVDVGRAINPSGLEAQLQGVVSDAITAMLRAGNRLDDGRIREGSYGDFLWARMKHAPVTVDVHIMEPNDEPGGAGELGFPTCAAAIVNAYSRATGEQPTVFPIGRPDPDPLPATLPPSGDAPSSIVPVTVNGTTTDVETQEGAPALYLMRDVLGVTGPKYGCGVGVCGACTSHKDGEAFRPCVTSVGDCAGSDITTIEGLAAEGELHPVQQAWIDEDVAQCGFCQPGQIMTAVALIAANPDPSDADIDAAMSDNVCRCGTYPRIRKAIKRAAAAMNAG